MGKLRVLIRQKPDRDNLVLYYVDPLTGREVTRSAQTSSRKEAERAAARWEAELEELGAGVGRLSWDQFRHYFEDTHMASRSRSYCRTMTASLNRFEEAVGCPRWLDGIDGHVIARTIAAWRAAGLSDNAVATYARHLKAAFRWAHRMGLMRRLPEFPILRVNGRHMRSRPITIREFQRVLRAVPAVRPDDWRQWVRFLRGLWYSGLRLNEALVSSWTDPPIRVELDAGRYPRFVMRADGQKARRDEIVPMAPDCAEWLARIPEERRVGRAFPLLTRRGTPFTKVRKVSAIIAEIGQASGVVVNDEGKHVTAHDLRRSFGTRWAKLLKPAALKRLMRHTSIETTMRYYVGGDADDIAEEIWKAAKR